MLIDTLKYDYHDDDVDEDDDDEKLQNVFLSTNA